MKTKYLVAAGVLALLTMAGCGGGDDSGAGNGIDTTPFGFDLRAVTDAEPDTYYTATAKISGINAPAPVSIVGGEFSLDDGKTFQTDGGRIENLHDVMVRIRSSRKPSDEVKATLSVGGVTADFVVKTVADTEAPELAVHFPPPLSMTDAPIGGATPASITVRGHATDDVMLAKVMVNDMEATLDDASGEWTFNYEIKAGDNLIEVVATDYAGNEVAKTLMLTHVNDSTGMPFGAGAEFVNPKTAFWDPKRASIVVTDSQFVSVSLATAERVDVPLIGIPFDSCGLHDLEMDRYIACGATDASIVMANPDSGAVETITVKGDGKGDDTDFSEVDDIAFDAASKRVFARVENDTGGVHIWTVDADPESASFGKREKFSSETFVNAGGFNYGIAVDSARNRLLVPDDCNLKTLSLDAALDDPSSTFIAAAPDFCIEGITVRGNKAWAKKVIAGANELIEISLETGEYRSINLMDPAFGPVVENLAYHGAVAVDAGGIVYTAVENISPADDGVIAIDPSSGFRVIVAQD